MSIINKKKMNELLNLSNDPKIELIEETKKSYKMKITGDKDKVKKSSFEEIVLEFIKEQKEFNKEQKKFNKEQREFNQKVDQRLNIIEDKLDIIQSLPTIKRELKNIK